MEQDQAFVQLLPDLGQVGCSATVVTSPVGKPFCWKNHRVLLIPLLDGVAARDKHGGACGPLASVFHAAGWGKP